MVVIASGAGGGGSEDNAGAWCKADLSGMATTHHMRTTRQCKN